MPGSPPELSALERLVRDGTDRDIRRFFLLLRPPELADLVENLSEQDRLRVLRLMSTPLAADVLAAVEEAERGEIVGELSSAELARVVPHMMSDDAADLVASLPPDKAERTLDKLGEDAREQIRGLLEYPEESAGGIMQAELISVPADVTVEQAIETVRRADAEQTGDIHEVFVVDREGRLLGSVTPSQLLQAQPAEPVRGVAQSNPVAVPVDMDQEELARTAREHDLAAVPVVDPEGRLLGQVLYDDIADVLQEEATEDIARLAGTDPEQVYEDRVLRAVRRRALWLLPAFAGGLGVALVMGMAEEELRRASFLLAFVPVILGMAGNVGTQSSALTVRGLALGRMEWSRAGRAIGRQILIGLGLGAIFSVLLFLFALLRGHALDRAGDYALAVGLAILASMTVGALMGTAVPLLLHRAGRDPAIASSPFVQTMNDLTGVGILIIVAYWTGLLR